jgi:excinuclease ABC subunit A
MARNSILIAGAREHNLKNITVEIPRNRLTVVTGLSGSGKSSLAFDTLYAEGQRRYVESLSAYARQFLDQMQKPDVDFIEGLSPAISIEQRSAGSNPRSIVATSTEIHDYLRLLFAHVGVPHCPKCRRPVKAQSAQEIVALLMQHPAHTKLALLAPLVRGAKGEHAELLGQVRKQGFVRVRVDGEVLELEQVPKLARSRAHTIEVVVDRLMITSKVGTRLSDSVELALKHGKGVMVVLSQQGSGGWQEAILSEKFACAVCGISFEKLLPRSFSFNSPYGACPTCSGLGTQMVFDPQLIVPDSGATLDGGAVQAWRKGPRRLITFFKNLLRAVAAHYGFRMDQPFRDLSEEHRQILLHGSGGEPVQYGFWRGGAYRKITKPFEGIIPNLERRLESTDSEYMKQKLRAFMSRRTCPVCRGARLRPEALACTVGGRSILDVTRLSIQKAEAFFSDLPLTEMERKIGAEVLKEIRHRLRFLSEVGLGYLTLDRESGTLSGGETQRIRLATQIGSGLVGVLYVLDEPTIGLHVRDNQRLLRVLKELRDVGNTVVVVEHDEEMIREADHVIDLGPGAGRLGGEVVFEGSVQDLIACPRSLTGRYLGNPSRAYVPRERKPAGRAELRILGAEENNLKKIDVGIPVGLLVCVTGVSGSGKSTLVDGIIKRAMLREIHGAQEIPGRHRKILGAHRFDKVIEIDQSPIGRTPRSNPATYTGAFTEIRKLFAATTASRVRGYGPGRYSFNVKGGRCEKCKGDGILRLEMHFLPDVYVTCEQCGGLRYNEETLNVQYAGRNIAQVLAMTVDESLEVFASLPSIHTRLRTLSEVGLGYLQLGQSATTLSGGEAQRIKMSAELSRKATGQTLYLLDEPTTGLHFADTQKLMQVLLRFRDAGNTVVVIEHNMDVIKTADYIIDLGPEGGDAGGEVVVAGTPEEVAACERSHTGQYLRNLLA